MVALELLVLELVAGLRERKESPGMSSTLMVEVSVQFDTKTRETMKAKASRARHGAGWGSHRVCSVDVDSSYISGVCNITSIQNPRVKKGENKPKKEGKRRCDGRGATEGRQGKTWRENRRAGGRGGVFFAPLGFARVCVKRQPSAGMAILIRRNHPKI